MSQSCFPFVLTVIICKDVPLPHGAENIDYSPQAWRLRANREARQGIVSPRGKALYPPPPRCLLPSGSFASTRYLDENLVQLNCHVFNPVFTLRKEAESRVFGMLIPSVTWNREFQKEAGVGHCLGRSWLGIGKSLDLLFCQLGKTQNSEGKRYPTHPAPWDPDPATQSNSHCLLNYFILQSVIQ